MLDLHELASAIGEDALLPTVGHELRGPLSSICGYLETLVEDELDPPTTRRFLTTAWRQARHLQRLIDALLAVPSSERCPSGAARCDAVAQIRRTVEMLAPLARRYHTTVRTQLPASAVARVDGDELIHALANLVENAVRHGARTLVAIACRRAEGFIEIAVDDDGDGIDPQERRRIFATGVRGASARAGHGIGLAVVRTIAERCGGNVHVERSALGGARFVLRVEAG